jgi:hypothetical protein
VQREQSWRLFSVPIWYRTFGSLPIGGQMKAYLAIVLKFTDGKISEQRNYDCYEPW